MKQENKTIKQVVNSIAEVQNPGCGMTFEEYLNSVNFDIENYILFKSYLENDKNQDQEELTVIKQALNLLEGSFQHHKKSYKKLEKDPQTIEEIDKEITRLKKEGNDFMTKMKIEHFEARKKLLLKNGVNSLSELKNKDKKMQKESSNINNKVQLIQEVYPVIHEEIYLPKKNEKPKKLPKVQKKVNNYTEETKAKGCCDFLTDLFSSDNKRKVTPSDSKFGSKKELSSLQELSNTKGM